MNYKIRKYVTLFLLIASVAVFVFSAGRVLTQLAEEKRAKAQFDALKSAVHDYKATAAPSAENTEASLPPDAPVILPQYKPLYEQNPDLFGWIQIEDTPIDYPVMYTPQAPERYLRRGFDGKYSVSGVPFIDGACVEDGNYYIICGHHMKNKTMFGTLPYYKDKAYWEEHRLIRFDTLFETREYEIFAAFYSKVYDSTEKDAFKYYLYYDLREEDAFSAYLAGVSASALYDTGVAVEYGDELLALSTCNYHTADGRFVVVAKRVK
ncbi:MAG: class B sortase [Clostridia bacterium]|nr:class B sortase [Clostridia bacterium]